MGGIGQRIGERSRAFGMSIIYRNRSPLPAHLEQGARFVECVSQLCAESDFLLLSCPSTEATRRIVDRDLLEIGRASGRERVCQSVSILVVAVSSNKKNIINSSQLTTK